MMNGFSPATPRDLAKLLIRDTIAYGATLKYLAEAQTGMAWKGHSVAIAGSYRENGRWIDVDCWHIAVDQFAGQECAHIFRLRDIYREIERELKRGFAAKQESLWEARA
jgi:hypothetical protein